MFFRADEDEDEYFGWGEDDQDDDHNTIPPRPSSGDTNNTAVPTAAGGALGAMAPSPEGRMEEDQDMGEEGEGEGQEGGDDAAAALDTPVFGQVGQGRKGRMKTLASAAAAAEIARLAEALRVCEAERARLAAAVAVAGAGEGEGVADNDGRSSRGTEGLSTRERDAAAAAEVWCGVVWRRGCLVLCGMIKSFVSHVRASLMHRVKAGVEIFGRVRGGGLYGLCTREHAKAILGAYSLAPTSRWLTIFVLRIIYSTRMIHKGLAWSHRNNS